MVIVSARFRIEEDSRAALMAELRKLISATRNEAGNIAFEWSVDIDDPNILVLHEVWESADSLGAHMKSPHMQEAGKTVMPHFVRSDVTRYEATLIE